MNYHQKLCKRRSVQGKSTKVVNVTLSLIPFFLIYHVQATALKIGAR